MLHNGPLADIPKQLASRIEWSMANILRVMGSAKSPPRQSKSIENFFAWVQQGLGLKL